MVICCAVLSSGPFARELNSNLTPVTEGRRSYHKTALYAMTALGEKKDQASHMQTIKYGGHTCVCFAVHMA